MKIQEAIRKFKESERPEQIIPMLNDDKLNDLISAWDKILCSYDIMIDILDGPPAASEWIDMWLNVQIPTKEASEASGIPLSEIKIAIDKAIGHQLIYPDGTVNQYAQQYLRSVILDKLPKKK